MIAIMIKIVKNKTPPPVWRWGSINLVNKSEPNRHAAQQQQRIQQQVQIQIAIHGKKFSEIGGEVKR